MVKLGSSLKDSFSQLNEEVMTMKQTLLIVVALMVASSTATLAGQGDGYIGLFIDSSHSHSCATGVGLYPVEMWIWTLPSMNGTICAEFAISYPPNVIQSTRTDNTSIISVSLGDLPTGMSVCYIACQWSWHWCFHQLLYVTDPTPTQAEIIPHPDTGLVQLSNCEPGYPGEPVILFTVLKLNQECPPENPIGAKETSWGAIKSMYGD
jgi:hypothetical protein